MRALFAGVLLAAMAGTAHAQATSYVLTCGSSGCAADDGTTQPAGAALNRELWTAQPASSDPARVYVPDTGQALYAPAASLASASTLSTSAFFARFTQAETLAVSAASNASAAINAGLVQGLAAGSVDLTSPVLRAWVDGLVQAGALTTERETAILTP